MPLMVKDRGEPLNVEPGAVHIMLTLGYRVVAESPTVATNVEQRTVEPAVRNDSPTSPDAPKGNATRAAWREYAESLGVKTEGLTRAQIRDAVAARKADEE